ncbi:MAG: hypothetical protein LH629_11865 [Ignavibacteria bacterium]|nr:hypothetical protein [Ignavibacteria bacterium]
MSVTGIFAQTAPPKNYNTGASTNEFILKQNFPNPFNEVTLIVFDLMKENYIKISVRDGNGKIIETLVDGIVESGTKSVFFKPSADLKSGKYICQMDVYSKDKSKIINSLTKEMSYDKNRTVVFKK